MGDMALALKPLAGKLDRDAILTPKDPKSGVTLRLGYDRKLGDHYYFAPDPTAGRKPHQQWRIHHPCTADKMEAIFDKLKPTKEGRLGAEQGPDKFFLLYWEETPDDDSS